MVERTRLLGLTAWCRQRAGNGRNNTHSMTMSLGEVRAAGRLRPGGATSARVEAAARQPAGGGVAQETQAGRATARGDSILDGAQPVVPLLLAEIRPAAVIFAPLNCFTGFHSVACVASASRQSVQIFVRSEFSMYDANFACGFERPKLMPSGKQRLFSSTDECEAKPFTDDARGFRARFSKIHKRYRPAMEFTDKRVSLVENASRRGDRPVHNLVCNVLMCRMEFRTRKYLSGAPRWLNI
jgi:hypothetical protein